MSDAEKAALEWLDVMIDTGIARANKVSEHSRTLKRLLAEPRLPEAATPEMQSVMFRAYREGEGVTLWSQVYRALYAHLTAPRTKEVWRVQPEGFPFEDHAAINAATARAGHWLAQDIEVSIRKTTVPA